jgi:hypothetical protein
VVGKAWYPRHMVPLRSIPSAAGQLIVQSFLHPNTDKVIVMEGHHVKVVPATDVQAPAPEAQPTQADAPAAS